MELCQYVERPESAVRTSVGLESVREADALVLHVELGVVLADEHVAQDPQRPVGRRDVDAHEARQAHRLAELRYLRGLPQHYWSPHL